MLVVGVGCFVLVLLLAESVFASFLSGGSIYASVFFFCFFLCSSIVESIGVWGVHLGVLRDRWLGVGWLSFLERRVLLSSFQWGGFLLLLFTVFQSGVLSLKKMILGSANFLITGKY